MTTTTTTTTTSSLNFAQISLKLRRDELLQNRVRNHRPSFTQQVTTNTDFNDHSVEDHVNNHRVDHDDDVINGGKIQTEQLYYPVTSAEIREKDSPPNTRLREGLLRKGLQNHRIRGGTVSQIFKEGETCDFT